MKKRHFLQALLASGAVAIAAPRLLKKGQFSTDPPVMPHQPEVPAQNSMDRIIPEPDTDVILLSEKDLEEGFKHHERVVDINAVEDPQVDHYLEKIRNFNADFPTDIHLPEEKIPLLQATIKRLERVQSYVGHGNYNLLGFDEMLFFARNYEDIGAFTDVELDFLEEIFSTDAHDYGFYGEKVTSELTSRISMKDVIKIPYSGHYLWRGESLSRYEQIRSDVGDQLLLTSGIRNVVKQLHLFLGKAVQSNYNLSKASRSLAPPGHSFHGVGDFDVGKIGLGEQNFTADFSRTEEFRRMISLGYIDIRYTDDNHYGVRYEPWHIKIA